MADTYWLSFRLHDSDGYERTYKKRLDALHAELEAASGGGSNWWMETTSFYFFSSDETASQIATRIKRAVAETVDVVVFGKTDYKTARAVGAVKDPDVFDLVPFMQKA